MTNSKELLAAVHLTKAKVKSLPAFDYSRRAEYDAALDRLCGELAAAGAAIGDRHDGAWVRWQGIRASATAGRSAAISNWVAAAYRWLDRENG